MTPNWLTYWQVFCAPWRQRKTEKNYGGMIAIAVLLLPFIALMAFLVGRATGKELLVGCGMISLVVVTMLWATQIQGTLQLNHPVPARLVPGYLQAQRRLLLTVWLAYAGLQTPAVWAVLTALPPPLLPSELRSPFVALVISATELMFLAIVLRWVWLGVLSLFIGPWLGPLLSPLLDVGPSAQEAAVRHAHWLGAALLAAFAWLLTHGVLRSGNAAHRAAHTTRAELRRLWTLDPTQKGPSFAAPGHKVSKWFQFYSYPYLQYTHWLLKTAQPTPRSVMARVDLSLSGSNHWVKHVSNVIALLALAVVVSVFVEWGWGTGGASWANPRGAGSSLGGVLVALLVGVAVSPMAGPYGSMLRSQREHGLLVLLPGCPHGPALNYALAKRHLLQSAVWWVIILLTMLAFQGNTTVRSVALLLWIAVLPVLPFVIQDWSKVKLLRPGQVFLTLGIFPVGLCIALSAHFLLDITWQAIALPAFALCVGNLIWRWRKLANYPQALPAGRLAQ